MPPRQIIKALLGPDAPTEPGTMSHGLREDAHLWREVSRELLARVENLEEELADAQHTDRWAA